MPRDEWDSRVDWNRDDGAYLWAIYARDPDYAIEVIKARRWWARLCWPARIDGEGGE